jgi:hypothetical protein
MICVVCANVMTFSTVTGAYFCANLGSHTAIRRDGKTDNE